MPRFTITVQRITDFNSPDIQHRITLAKKGLMPYTPQPDACYTFRADCADRKAAKRLASADNTLRFSGEEMVVLIDGTLELGNH